MKILCLYNNPCALELFEWIKDQGHDIVLMKDELSEKWCRKNEIELTVSYTYRFILDREVLRALKGNVVNLHNSFLPWNRGADPNIWSIVDDTPRGVTLHYMDGGLDKGYIIAQKFVPIDNEKTLADSYYDLDRAAKELFKEAFEYYKFWPEMKKAALGRGNYHSLKDRERTGTAIQSYNMLVKDLRSVAGGGYKA